MGVSCGCNYPNCPLKTKALKVKANLLFFSSYLQQSKSLLKHNMSIPTVGIPESCTINSERTIAGTAAKTEKRTAHVPKKVSTQQQFNNFDIVFIF